MAAVLGPPVLEHLAYIAANLRARDRDEIFAVRHTEDPEALALDTFNTGAFQWIAYRDQEPVAAIGAVPLWPRVWNLWAYGTDRWPEVVLKLTRHARSFMLPALYNAGAIRAQCYALEAHQDARKWLELLGGVQEHTLTNFGKNGETFVLYSWGRDRTRSLRHVPHERLEPGSGE